MHTAPHRHRFNVSEYYRVAEEFLPETRTELIDGEIIEMVPPGNRHAACVSRLIRLLTAQVGPSAIVRVQDPLRLSDFYEPQPDIALLRNRADFYEQAHPGAADTLLVIEVSGSSYVYDRHTKVVPTYARHGVPEVWLVNLEQELIEVYREPVSDEYTSCRSCPLGETLSGAGVSLPVAAVFGR